LGIAGSAAATSALDAARPSMNHPRIARIMIGGSHWNRIANDLAAGVDCVTMDRGTEITQKTFARGERTGRTSR
jgi:hypothetical protein